MANPTLYVAWQGVPGDDAIHFTSPPLGADDAPTFPYGQVQPFGPEGHPATSTRPTIMRVVNGIDGPNIGMAFKGVESDGTIYFSGMQGAFADAEPSPRWSGPAGLVGGTTWGPASTAFNGGLFFAWKGTGSDTGIWGNLDTDTPGTVRAQFVTGIRSALSPALTTFGNQLIMVWRGEGDIDGLFWAVSSNGTAWTHMGPIANAATTDIPSLTVFNNQVWLAFKGLDTSIYLSNIVDVGDLTAGKAQWQPRWTVPGIGTTNGPSICAFGDQLIMSWKGSGDTDIWYSQSRTGAENAWSTSGQLQRTIPGVGTSYGPALFVFTG